MSEGLRYDKGKTRLDLLPPEWIEALGVVMTKGAEKYADRNWELGMPWSKCWGPLLRHAFKWLAGEMYDAETGVHHLAHVAWNALALMSYQCRNVGEADLPRPVLFNLVARGVPAAPAKAPPLPPPPAASSEQPLSEAEWLRERALELESYAGTPAKFAPSSDSRRSGSQTK
jgi:hypothetical protein